MTWSIAQSMSKQELAPYIKASQDFREQSEEQIKREGDEE